MFAGHYSSALVAKAAAPRVPLWTLLIAAQFVDILWVIFVFSGLEHARLVPGLPSSPLDLYYMPYTHSLLATCFWSAIAFVVAQNGLRLGNGAALVVAATVASHWFLDLLVHRPDLPIAFGARKLGLGIWDYPVPAYLLEVLCIVVSMWLCVRSCGVTGRRLRPWLGFAGGLVLLQTATAFGPLPTSLTGMLVSALALYLLIPWVGARVERA
jgi:hypothetical protein